MADENTNNNNSTNQRTEDVLGSVTGASSLQKQVASINSSVQSIDATTQELKTEVAKFIAKNRTSNAQVFSSAASDYTYKSRTQQNQSSARVPSSSSAKRSASGRGVIEDALNGFEETLCEYLGVPYIGDDVSKTITSAFDKYAENLASAVGSSVDDLPKKLAAELTKRSIQSFASANPNVDTQIKSHVGKYKNAIDSVGKKLAQKWNTAVAQTISDSEVASVLSADSILGKKQPGNADAAQSNSVQQGTSSSSAVRAVSGSVKSDALSAVDYWWDIYNDVIGIKETDSFRDVIRGDSDATSSWAANKAESAWKSWFIDNPDAVESAAKGDSALGDVASSVAQQILDAKNVKPVPEVTTASIGDLASAGESFASILGGDVSSAVKTLFSNGIPSLTEAGAALSSVAPELAAVAPELLAAAAAVTAVELLAKPILAEFDRTVKRLGSAADKLSKGWGRADETRWANVEAQEKRFQQDAETFVRAPFKILEDAANKVYEVWDSALQTINATQGYSKADLQDLMTSYAVRLRKEGMSSVVGTTDVTSMLQQIIKSGLSGKVAEEFAYQATLLNKAIPTEDFSQYAASYASLASQYMSLGHSQQEALQYANTQLKMFASNVLTASREVSGGFTTSLTGVSSLFSDIVKITETGKSTDTTALSSALSAVQAVAGTVSPDVGNSLVSQIVSAATGGNASGLTALRSLAGTGASNTAFLQALVKDPSKVLAKMFSNINSMLSSATDNYMEVAYSLSDTFGISVDALTRVDWDKLVSALENSSSSSTALNQNMQLLASGETTSSAESQRLQQINEYMIDQGLAYVLDNESARLIQQHMWDQEIAKQIQEATYAVDFAGGALELITTVAGLIQNIVDLLTLKPLVNTVTTAVQSNDLKKDIAALIEAGKVGKGNATALHDLTTYDVNALSSTPNILDMWGKKSNYYDGLVGVNSGINKGIVDNFFSKVNALTNTVYGGADTISSMMTNAPSSKYSWGNASKSSLGAFSSYTKPDALAGLTSPTASSQIASNTATALGSWINSMSDFVSQNKSYDEWYASAKEYGFSDALSAVKQAGYSEEDLKREYSSAVTQSAIEEQSAGKALEGQFYSDAIQWIETTYPANWESWNTKYDTNVVSWLETFTTQMADWSTLYTDTMTAFTDHFDETYKSWSTLYTEATDETHKNQKYLNTKFDESFINDFLYEWKDYYIGNHTHYRAATNFDSSLRAINSEKTQTGQAVLALAQSLTKNYEDLADPAVQTNVLLGQVVVLLQSILTAQQSGKGLTLPSSLAALGLNITKSGS